MEYRTAAEFKSKGLGNVIIFSRDAIEDLAEVNLLHVAGSAGEETTLKLGCLGWRAGEELGSQQG